MMVNFNSDRTGCDIIFALKELNWHRKLFFSGKHTCTGLALAQFFSILLMVLHGGDDSFQKFPLALGGSL